VKAGREEAIPFEGICSSRESVHCILARVLGGDAPYTAAGRCRLHTLPRYSVPRLGVIIISPSSRRPSASSPGLLAHPYRYTLHTTQLYPLDPYSPIACENSPFLRKKGHVPRMARHGRPPLSSPTRLGFDTMSHFNRNVMVIDGRTRSEIAGDLHPYRFVTRTNNVPAHKLLAVWSNYHRNVLPMDSRMHCWTRFDEIILMRK